MSAYQTRSMACALSRALAARRNGTDPVRGQVTGFAASPNLKTIAVSDHYLLLPQTFLQSLFFLAFIRLQNHSNRPIRRFIPHDPSPVLICYRRQSDTNLTSWRASIDTARSERATNLQPWHRTRVRINRRGLQRDGAMFLQRSQHLPSTALARRHHASRLDQASSNRPADRARARRWQSQTSGRSRRRRLRAHPASSRD